MSNIMVDIETFGQHANAVIVSIGAVEFTEDGLGKKFYRNIEISSSVKAGRGITGETLQWWFEQDPAALKALTTPTPEKFDTVMREFKTWISGILLTKNDNIWANGVSFDLGIIRHAFKSLDMNYPWRYWQESCMRSLRAIEHKFGLNWQSYVENSNVVYHNALHDAELQAKYVIDFMKKGDHGEIN